MSNNFVIGPIAPENNPAIMPQWFQPSNFPITAISTGPTTTITTGMAFGVSVNYVIGQVIRLVIPPEYGAQQLNGQQGEVIALPSSNQVTVNINSLNTNPFNASPSHPYSSPQIIAIGDVNSGILSTTGRDIVKPLLPGSFENISPAPFL